MFTRCWMMWIILLLACAGASWFSYQCLLVPQPQRFNPDWRGAQWIKASDASTPVAYFRHVVNINAIPDAAFVTVAASQVFRLYIDGTFVASNGADFLRDSSPMSYMYDISPFLHAGVDVIGVRVANVDNHAPGLRMNLGLVVGSSISFEISSFNWLATSLSTRVYPRSMTNPNSWSTTNFFADWPLATIVYDQTASPPLSVNPQLYERPVPWRWLSSGASHEAYFLCQIPAEINGSTWLRLAATGVASVFINGQLLFIWNGQAPLPRQNLAGFLGEARTAQPARAYLAPGIYNISPYLHAATNTLAVHVLAPGISMGRAGTDRQSAAVSLDLLSQDAQGRASWLPSPTSWHSSARFVAGWTDGSSAALHWPLPLQVARPAVNSTLYLPNSAVENTQVFPFLLVYEDILITSTAVIVTWLLMALVVRRYHRSYGAACETASTVYLPALACEAVLIVLSHETLLPQPFPYTFFWGAVLIMLAVSCYALFCLRVHSRRQKYSKPLVGLSFPFSWIWMRLFRRSLRAYPYLPKRLEVWFKRHWAIALLMLIASPLIFYDLAYEPYWQDELASYYAAHGVLAHGLPFFPSGFLYEKAELYSYLLALWTALFGASSARSISAIEYLVSLPLLYFVGCYFFNQRVALLAAAMLAFSPLALQWGRQVRMYEQAQLLTLLVVYLFYRAVREQRRVRLLCIAILCLVLDYLSHEETFIILPALVACVLLLSRKDQHRLPTVLYQKRWWCALCLGALCIVVQLLLTRATHPPILGTDSSQRPFVQISTENVPFYLRLLFSPSPGAGSSLLVLNTVLALIGCVYAGYECNPCARYCALFLGISFLTLVLVFTMRADRYFYPLLPIYYLVGSYALAKMMNAVWNFACSSLKQLCSTEKAASVHGTSIEQYLSHFLRLKVLRLSMLAICGCVLLAPMLPISNYSHFVSHLAGLSSRRHYPDYDAVGQYMRQHWRQGDIVISVAPDFSVYYYIGHVDYFFSLDRALFLFERNGHIVDTSIGITALLNQSDLLAALAAHPRAWIISDNAQYQAQVSKRFTFPPDFHIVFEGYGSAIYLRGG